MSISRKFIAIAAGVAVFAGVSASAATLGGIKTNDLGANSNDVKAQLTGGVGVAWTTAFDGTLHGYKVTGLTLTALTSPQTIPATAAVAVTLKDVAGASLGEYKSTDGGATWSTVPVATVAAASVYGASVVINGGTFTAVAPTLP